MGNTDWWAQSQAPRTAEQQYHAQQAAKIERQWELEAQEIEAERWRRKKSGYSMFMISGGCLLVGMGALAFPDLLPSAAIMLPLAFAFAYAGVKRLIWSI